MASDLFQTPVDVSSRFREAVQFYWDTRTKQAQRQQEAGEILDAGLRSSVMGGAHNVVPRDVYSPAFLPYLGDRYSDGVQGTARTLSIKSEVRM